MGRPAKGDNERRMTMEPMNQPDPDPEKVWRGILMGTDPRYRKARALYKHLPREPRCKMCAAPFGGPIATIMRMRGRGRWSKNPKYCGMCFTVMSQVRGGAEIPCTLLFADVRGSTELAERIAPSEFSRLLNRFYDTAGRILVENDAIVDKFVGDEVMAIFIPALAQERHAARGVAAAREILRAVDQLGEGDEALPIGIGIHTGNAFVGAVGEAPHTELTALGDVVNTAARLASAAAAGEILVSREAADAAGLESGPLEHRSLELKGKSARTDVVVLTVAAS
jgi:adenylate cyclase